MRKLVSFVLLSVIASGSSAADICSEVVNYGKVARILPWNNWGTVFLLKGGVTQALMSGTKGRCSYVIKLTPATASTTPTAATDLANNLYRSQHDLLVEAAKAGWTVKVRTKNCSTTTGQTPVAYADVEFIYVDLP